MHKPISPLSLFTYFNYYTSLSLSSLFSLLSSLFLFLKAKKKKNCLFCLVAFVFFFLTLMEPKQPHNQQAAQPNEEGGNGKGGFLCRQSSTRWTPTTDQIRILKDLYYNNGVRSPSADQIQRISARLRQYGKIEGKNVFYWFQNHKARERQKKRFTSTSDHHHHLPIPKQQQQPSPSLLPSSPASWKPPEDSSSPFPNNNLSHGVSSAAPSSSLMVAVGHMGNYGYGSATVENSFRDCSISSGGSSSSVVGSRSHNMGWIGVDPYSSPATTTLFEKRKSVEESMEEDQEIETLPLFPIHGDRNLGGFCSMKPEYSDGYYTTWYGRSDEGAAGSRTSLELSLNSYAAISPDDAI